MLLSSCVILSAILRLGLPLLPNAQILSLSPGEARRRIPNGANGVDHLVRESEDCDSPTDYTWKAEGACAIVYDRPHCGAGYEKRHSATLTSTRGDVFDAVDEASGPLDGWRRLTKTRLGSAIIFPGCVLEIGRLESSAGLSSTAFQGPLVVQSFARRPADSTSLRCFCRRDADAQQALPDLDQKAKEQSEVLPDPFRGDKVAGADHLACGAAKKALQFSPEDVCAVFYKRGQCAGHGYSLPTASYEAPDRPDGRFVGIKGLRKLSETNYPFDQIGSLIVPEGKVLEILSDGFTTEVRVKLFSGVTMLRLEARAELSFRCTSMKVHRSIGHGVAGLPLDFGRDVTWVQLGTGPSIHANEREALARALARSRPSPKGAPTGGAKSGGYSSPSGNLPSPWRDLVAGEDHPRCRVTEAMRAEQPDACAFFFAQPHCRGRPHAVKTWAFVSSLPGTHLSKIPGLRDLDDVDFEGELASFVVAKGRLLEIVDESKAVLFPETSVAELGERSELNFRCYHLHEEGQVRFHQTFGEENTWVQFRANRFSWLHFADILSKTAGMKLLSKDKVAEYEKRSGHRVPKTHKSASSHGESTSDPEDIHDADVSDEGSKESAKAAEKEEKYVADPWVGDVAAPMDHPPCAARAQSFLEENPTVCAVLYPRPHCDGVGHTVQISAYQSPVKTPAGTSVPGLIELEQRYGSLVVGPHCFFDIVDMELGPKTKIFHNVTMARLGERGAGMGRVLVRSYPLRDARGRPHVHLDYGATGSTWLQVGEEVFAAGDLGALKHLKEESVYEFFDSVSVVSQPHGADPLNHTSTLSDFDSADGLGAFRHKTPK